MRVTAALALCATLASACSFTFMRPAPPGPPASAAECRTTLTLPAVDLALAAVLVALYLGASDCRDFYGHECSTLQEAAGPAAVALPLVASATYGYLQQRRCVSRKPATAPALAVGVPVATPADAGAP
jgi:hypothetical protein